MRARICSPLARSSTRWRQAERSGGSSRRSSRRSAASTRRQLTFSRVTTGVRPRRPEVPRQGSGRTLAERRAISPTRSKWISQDTSQVVFEPAVGRGTRPEPTVACWRSVLPAVARCRCANWTLALASAGGGLQATNLRLVSTFSGEHWGASFSPDGRFIAFLKEVNGVPQVWVKNLAEGEPLEVTFGDVPVRQLSWSPRDDRIVFSRFRAGLWSVPPLGGAARRVLEFGEAPKVSANGRRMVFSRGMAIWTANADGSNAREVAGGTADCRGRPSDRRHCHQTVRRSPSSSRARRPSRATSG